MLDTILEVKNASKLFSKPAKQTSTTNAGWLAMLNILFSNNHKRITNKSFKVLDDITFSFKKGESIGIIGLNGAGKSTLVQIIAGPLQRSTGNVHTYGKVVALLELGTGLTLILQELKILTFPKVAINLVRRIKNYFIIKTWHFIKTK